MDQTEETSTFVKGIIHVLENAKEDDNAVKCLSFGAYLEENKKVLYCAIIALANNNGIDVVIAAGDEA